VETLSGFCFKKFVRVQVSVFREDAVLRIFLFLKPEH
jgi:hypothetical protein